MVNVNSNVTTIGLTGSEEKVQFAVPYSYYWVLNTSGADMYMSMSEGITANADGVITVPAGGVACTMHGAPIDTVYLLGTGSCLVMGTYSAHCPFKVASGGGDNSSGESIIAWLPVISSDGIISWSRSQSTTAPTPQNIKGKNGITYTPVIGTVTTVDSSEEASAEVVIDDENHTATYNFAIPRGEKGDTETDGTGSSFILESATETELGGVLSGGDISVDESGAVTVNSVNGKTVGANVPENAVFTDTVYTLPTASESELGGVKVDGTTVKIDENGVISAEGDYVPVSGGTMEGALIAQSNTDYTVAQVRNVIISSEAPSGTAPEGTIWYQYEVTE